MNTSSEVAIPSPPRRHYRTANDVSQFSLTGDDPLPSIDNNNNNKKTTNHPGKRTFGTNQLETIGMSPATFRAGGKKHVPPPYSVTDSAKEIIRASSAEGSARSPRGGGDYNNNSRPGTSDGQDNTNSARRQEKRLIESLIAFPHSSQSVVRNKRTGKVEVQLSVPRAFQTDNVDWRPSGPHDHIPALPEKAPKKELPKVGPSEDDPRFLAVDPRLLRHPRANLKGPSDIKGIHHDEFGKPKKYNSTEITEKLWRDMENRKKSLEKAQKQDQKEDAKLCKYGPNSKKITEDNLEDFVQRFQTQPLHSKHVKHNNLTRKYAPPLTKKQTMGKGEMRGSIDRLYYQAKEKSIEAHEKARQKYVENMKPKFAKISAEEIAESAARLSSREAQ